MRDEILELLEKEYDALSLDMIAKKLNITAKEDIDRLQYDLNKLCRDKIVRNTNKDNYLLFSHCNNFKTGKLVDISLSGNGIFVADDNITKVFVPIDSLNTALEGDEVTVELVGSDEKGFVGKVVKILKRSSNNIVGEIVKGKKELYFKPKAKLSFNVVLDKKDMDNLVEGNVVVVVLGDRLSDGKFGCKLGHILGHKDDPGMDIISVAAKYDIFAEYPEAAMKQAEEMPSEVTDEDRKERTDLTNQMIFTIDGADTKDIDDAISLEVKDGYYNLGVHIADVSYYVTEKSPLDEEAYTRGTSSYLANSVIPMLPHKLSNGICSLNEGVDRCAISCVMKIDSKGRVRDYDIFPSIIRSNKKMTYKSVNHIIEDGIVDEGYEPFKEKLIEMNELAHIIRADRVRRGASDFDIPEAKIICDETGKAVDVQARERGEGERLIEDFMIAANETVADFFLRPQKMLNYEYGVNVLPGVYRVHDVPSIERVQKFIQFCEATGHSIKGKYNDTLNPKTFQKLLEQVKVEGPEAKIFRTRAVRSMAKAVYSSENIGHFGLASTHYTHFTSPIRRYPDLETHRLLHKFLFNKELEDNVLDYYYKVLPDITKQCSDREQKADEAEREVDKMKMAEYMESHIGEVYTGVISDISERGFYVDLDNLVSGLVRVDSIPGDYYEYSEESYMLVGQHTGKRFCLGDEITIVVADACKELGQITFEIPKKLKKDNEGPVRKKVNNYGRSKK